MVSFNKISIGLTYSRPELATLWGYKSYQAISRGVFSPKNQNMLVFFVTEEKQDSLTPYIDHIVLDILFWEGEIGHGSDKRIISSKDEIHVFFRKKHHTDFTYLGLALLNQYALYSNRPSKFSFILNNQRKNEDEVVAEIKAQYNISTTMKDTLIKARIGQGKYRLDSIQLWKQCAVTGFSNQSILIASHIKPWKLADNYERINPYNSLLLVPTIDKLFDRGYIGFEPEGKILLSERISDSDWKKINVTRDLYLRKVPYQTSLFLEYHSRYIFDFVEP